MGIATRNPRKKAFAAGLWKVTALAAPLAVAAAAPAAYAQDSGEALFQQRCAQCHTIGKGRLVGPDLKGITSQRSADWLHRFISHPQQVAQSGDAGAKSLLAEYKIPMPDQDISSGQIDAILHYVGSAGGAPVGSAASNAQSPANVNNPAPAAPTFSARAADAGARLFTGETRFANGAVACIACHSVSDPAVPFGGGRLAVDLTGIFGQLGAGGINAMLSSPAFPPMIAAYGNHPLTSAEIADLIAFLQRASAQSSAATPSNRSSEILLGGGAVGLVLFLFLLNLVWRERKTEHTKRDIHARQISTF
jgi:cytochrome c2